MTTISFPRQIARAPTDTITTARFGAVGDGITDDTAAVQSAINHAIATDKGLTLSGLHLITEPLVVDRSYFNADYYHTFNFFSDGSAGFLVNTPMNLFTASYAGALVEQTHLLTFNNVLFKSNSPSVAAYVLDCFKIIRVTFQNCSFVQIKAFAEPTGYLQSIYFYGCNARLWIGKFAYAGTAYDVQVIGGIYENTYEGDVFVLYEARGCRFHALIEGIKGTALRLTRARSVDISCYFEGNNNDIDCATVEYGDTKGNTTYGVNINGSFFASTYGLPIQWGTAIGCVSEGNWCAVSTGAPMHTLTNLSMVQINDIAWGNGPLSNLDAATNRGYRQSSTWSGPTLRGVASAGYTVSGMTATYARTGNLVTAKFKCTLTSTGTNAADALQISGGLPYAGVAESNDLIMGYVTINTTHAVLKQVSTTTGQTLTSAIPSNVVSDAFTVRGELSYVCGA